MSITFFIPGSPTREVVYPATEYDEEWRTTEDIWPTANMSNGNAFHYAGALHNALHKRDNELFPHEFDYSGSWTPKQALLIDIELMHMMSVGGYDNNESCRMTRLSNVLSFAYAMDKAISWG